MESNIPKYDLPVDYIVGEGFAKDLLKSYKNFPCKIESGLFILCIKGTMEVTINTNTHHISENDLITLPPNCILVGLVSSKRRLHLPPYRFAKPKFRQMDFA